MGYTLRRISGRDVQMNHALGNGYTVVSYADATETFRTDYLRYFKKDFVGVTEDGVYAFVGNHDGSYIQPLYTSQQNYIMTESGSTFSNLTFKH